MLPLQNDHCLINESEIAGIKLVDFIALQNLLPVYNYEPYQFAIGALMIQTTMKTKKGAGSPYQPWLTLNLMTFLFRALYIPLDEKLQVINEMLQTLNSFS